MCIRDSTKAMQGYSDFGGGSTTKGTQASVLKNMSEADAIKRVGALFTADQKKSGILDVYKRQE